MYTLLLACPVHRTWSKGILFRYLKNAKARALEIAEANPGKEARVYRISNGGNLTKVFSAYAQRAENGGL